MSKLTRNDISRIALGSINYTARYVSDASYIDNVSDTRRSSLSFQLVCQNMIDNMKTPLPFDVDGIIQSACVLFMEKVSGLKDKLSILLHQSVDKLSLVLPQSVCDSVRPVIDMLLDKGFILLRLLVESGASKLSDVSQVLLNECMEYLQGQAYSRSLSIEDNKYRVRYSSKNMPGFVSAPNASSFAKIILGSYDAFNADEGSCTENESLYRTPCNVFWDVNRLPSINIMKDCNIPLFTSFMGQNVNSSINSSDMEDGACRFVMSGNYKVTFILRMAKDNSTYPDIQFMKNGKPLNVYTRPSSTSVCPLQSSYSDVVYFGEDDVLTLHNREEGIIIGRGGISGNIFIESYI